MRARFSATRSRNPMEPKVENNPSKSKKSGIDYYNSQQGKLSGREAKASARLTALTQKYQAEGMSAVDAKERALKELRDNARGDWRA